MKVSVEEMIAVTTTRVLFKSFEKINLFRFSAIKVEATLCILLDRIANKQNFKPSFGVKTCILVKSS